MVLQYAPEKQINNVKTGRTRVYKQEEQSLTN